MALLDELVQKRRFGPGSDGADQQRFQEPPGA